MAAIAHAVTDIIKWLLASDRAMRSQAPLSIKLNPFTSPQFPHAIAHFLTKDSTSTDDISAANARYSAAARTAHLEAALARLLRSDQCSPSSSSSSAAGRPGLATRVARLLERSQREAVTDTMTGLPDRRALTRDLEALAAESSAIATLTMFDLNGFKGYNHTFGHPAGDALLAASARRRRPRCGSRRPRHRLPLASGAVRPSAHRPIEPTAVAPRLVGPAAPAMACLYSHAIAGSTAAVNPGTFNSPLIATTDAARASAEIHRRP